MSDGEDDDDQPRHRERQRQQSRSRERVHPHVPVSQEPQIQLMVTPESDDEISDEDFTVVDSSSPAGPSLSIESGNRLRRANRFRSRERGHPRSSSHASQQQQPLIPPPEIQQNQANQTEDEDSVTVDPQNRVSNHSRSPQDHEDSRRHGPQKQKGPIAEKPPSTPPKAKKHKPMSSDEDDEETQK